MLSDISNVQFQYGTSLEEPSFPGVLIPEPATFLLGAAGLVLLLLRRRFSCP
jgi:hypothetical protein